VKLSVNGVPRPVPDDSTVADVVAEFSPGFSPGEARRGIAVAVNGTVVPRADWDTTALRDGDTVEVLTAVQGG
jgi:sulfur carrier protein